MKFNSLLVSALAVAALSLAGCNSLSKSTPTQPATTGAQSAVNPSAAAQSSNDQLQKFLGQWSITELAGKPVNVNGENHPNLIFEVDPANKGLLNVIGFDGCNFINGSWQVTGNKITKAGEFLTSLMSCPDAPYEQLVNQAINNTTGYVFVDDDNINFTDYQGKTLMKVRSRNLAFLNGAWRVTTIESEPVPAGANLKIVLDIDECKVHGEAGCNLLNGDIVVNLDKGDGIEFKDLATSRMTCPYIQTEQAFLLALEQVATASEGVSKDEALLKNGAGQTVIVLRRLSPDEIAD